MLEKITNGTTVLDGFLRVVVFALVAILAVITVCILLDVVGIL